MSDKTTEAEIRAHVRAAIQEHLKENSATNKPTESKQLSEVRTHIRRAINEIMVGLTPIARIDNANDANSGVDTPSAVDRADIGFNTFDMHEWASIAGITEESLNEEPEASTGDDTMLGGNDSDKRPTITTTNSKNVPNLTGGPLPSTMTTKLTVRIRDPRVTIPRKSKYRMPPKPQMALTEVAAISKLGTFKSEVNHENY